MGQRVIPVAVTAEYIGGDGVTLGAAGSHDSVVIEYDFRAAGPQWDDVTVRYVLWTNPQGNTTNRVNLGVDKLVPGYDNKVYHASPTADAMCVAGWAEMVVVGAIISDGNEVIKVKTEPSRFRVLPGSNSAADNEGIAATVADQLQSEIETVDSRKVSKPLSPLDPDGTDGQFLVSRGGGATEWVDMEPDVIEVVLKKHPEWVTTIRDGVITERKLSPETKARLLALEDGMTERVEDIEEDRTALAALKASILDVERRQTSPFNFKGVVQAPEDLPSGAEVNDTYYVSDLKYRMTWTGSEWKQSSLDEGDYEDELGAIRTVLDPQALHYELQGLTWVEGKTIATNGAYGDTDTEENRIACPNYLYLSGGSKIWIAPGYSVKMASYSSVTPEGGNNAFVFRENFNFVDVPPLVIPYDGYYRFAVRKADQGEITAEDGAEAFAGDLVAGLSVAGMEQANLLETVDHLPGMKLLGDGGQTLRTGITAYDYIPIVPGIPYILELKTDPNGTQIRDYTRVICYNADKEYINTLYREDVVPLPERTIHIVITAPPGAEYLRICYAHAAISQIALRYHTACDHNARLAAYQVGKATAKIQEEKFAVKRNNKDAVRQMVKVAETYKGRKTEDNEWVMHYSTNGVLSPDYNGERGIDCSTFIGMVLRGIAFDDSPYNPDYVMPEEYNPAVLVANPAYEWTVNPALYDYNLYQDVNYPALAEARRAAQIGQMMCDQGREVPVDPKLVNIEAGDILFFSCLNSETLEPQQPNRYRQISHIALVTDVSPAPAGASWEPSEYPLAHTYIDVSVGGNADPVAVKCLEAVPMDRTQHSILALSLVARPDLGAIAPAGLSGKRLVFHADGTVTWEPAEGT